MGTFFSYNVWIDPARDGTHNIPVSGGHSATRPLITCHKRENKTQQKKNTETESYSPSKHHESTLNHLTVHST